MAKTIASQPEAAADPVAADAAAPSPKRTITIVGKFSGGVNNRIKLGVFRSNSLPNPYNFKKTFIGDFTETINDLEPGLLYHLTFVGFTTTQFDLNISGEFEDTNPITDSAQNTSFTRRFSITTNP